MAERKSLPLPANWRQAYPSDFIKPIDLTKDNNYITAVCEVQRVTFEEVDNGKGKKQPTLILYFVGKKKGLLANVTICKQMQELAGTENPNDWPGTLVEMWVKTDEKNPQDKGKPTAIVVRLRKPANINTPPRSEPEPEDFPTHTGDDEDVHEDEHIDEPVEDDTVDDEPPSVQDNLNADYAAGNATAHPAPDQPAEAGELFKEPPYDPDGPIPFGPETPSKAEEPSKLKDAITDTKKKEK